MNILFWLLIITVIVHGIVASVSFDVALVKLPTRKRIGVVAYAKFARGNDMGNGIVVYPTIAILALLLIIATTFAAYSVHGPKVIMLPLISAWVGTVAHFVCTAKAAPNILSLKSAPDDEALLTRKLDAFATWHAYRALFQFLTFVVLVWALVEVCEAAQSLDEANWRINP